MSALILYFHLNFIFVSHCALQTYIYYMQQDPLLQEILFNPPKVLHAQLPAPLTFSASFCLNELLTFLKIDNIQTYTVVFTFRNETL